MTLHRDFYEIEEPAFPHRGWRVFRDHVELWDGQLVAYRRANVIEKSAFIVTLRLLADSLEGKVSSQSNESGKL